MANTETLLNLKIHKLSQEAYDTKKANNELESAALYLTPEQEASTTTKGIVQLSNATDGTSETLAATSKAVKDAADKALTAAKSYTDTKINDLDVSSPTATDDANNPIAFIDTIVQADGKIAATKKTIRSATTGASGVVQLNDSITSTSTSEAATANAVKQVNDKINALDFSDPVATDFATTFIDTISQTDGKISATKKTIPRAKTDSAGIVQLSNDISNTAEILAATPKAVKDALTAAKSYTDTEISKLDFGGYTGADGESTTFIDTVSQENGVVKATKKRIPMAKIDSAGIVQLSNATNSTAETLAATSKAVSSALSSAKSYADGKFLPKLTYEWNKEYNAGGTAGYLLIGSFPMYDTNITIDIDSTTADTYHGTVLIATQNVSNTSIGSAHTINVYDDPTGTISNALRVVWTEGSNHYRVYFVPTTWSKTFIHVRAMGTGLDDFDESTMCIFTEGAAPTTTDGLSINNVLRNNFYVTAGREPETTLGFYATAEGSHTTASGKSSHAEGTYSQAEGLASHAEGYNTTAFGEYSHAEGYYTTASHEASHASGYYTKTSKEHQTVVGHYNADNDSALFIVGAGDDDQNRSNALEVLDDGTVNVVALNADSIMTKAPTNDTHVATKQYVDNKVSTDVNTKMNKSTIYLEGGVLYIDFTKM